MVVLRRTDEDRRGLPSSGRVCTHPVRGARTESAGNQCEVIQGRQGGRRTLRGDDHAVGGTEPRGGPALEPGAVTPGRRCPRTGGRESSGQCGATRRSASGPATKVVPVVWVPRPAGGLPHAAGDPVPKMRRTSSPTRWNASVHGGRGGDRGTRGRTTGVRITPGVGIDATRRR